jgi:hypothetical protein
MSDRIEAVAQLLAKEIYNAEFAGKERGRFIVDRQQLKGLLGTPRLRDTALSALTDECLDWGLVLIDMDDKIGFAEAAYVEKWRKLPDRLFAEYVSELDADEDDDDEEDEDGKDE